MSCIVLFARSQIRFRQDQKKVSLKHFLALGLRVDYYYFVRLPFPESVGTFYSRTDLRTSASGESMPLSKINNIYIHLLIYMEKRDCHLCVNTITVRMNTELLLVSIFPRLIQYITIGRDA